jgi:polyhydroxyalkanoate synthesis regulator phasin
MSILDKIAEDHFDLIKDDEMPVDDSQNYFSEMMDTSDEKQESFDKQACSLLRIALQSDIDYHQNDKTKDFWNIKNGKILRSVSSVVKG